MTVQYDQPTPAGIHSGPSQVDGGPPKRSRLTVALAAVACAACCAVPVLLVSAGVLTATGAAVLSRSLAALSVGLLAAAGAMWWLHRRLRLLTPHHPTGHAEAPPPEAEAPGTPEKRKVQPGIPARSLVRDCLSSRDTCICDRPTSAAIRAWLICP